MSGLTKAVLWKLGPKPDDDVIGDPIEVQFNPASLKLTLSNNTEGGTTTGRPARQFTGNASTELAFDLEFDTADEDDGAGGPQTVRMKTALIEQFVLSEGPADARKSPPRVMFHWDQLIIKGVITSVSVELDLFSADGTPLHAKVGVSIKEQDAKYEIGTSKEKDAPAPGESNPSTPGNSGGGEDDPATNRTGTTQEGESLADFALRMGLDAGAWRGLAAGLEGTLSLEAGLDIDFSAGLSLSAGVGLSVGFEADLDISLEASLGLEASASISAGVSAGASASASAGFALSAAGGVSAAVETVKIAKAEAAASESIKAFGASGASASAAVSTGGTSVALSGAAAPIAAAAARSAPARASGGASATVAAGGGGAGGGTASAAAPAAAAAAGTASIGVAAAASGSPATPAAYAPPRADPRATGFGFGVPLRPAVTGAATTTQGVVALRPYARAADVPTTRNPTVPAWSQLPAGGQRPQRQGASAQPARPQGQGGRHRTGCGCGCGPKGGRP